MMRWVRGISFPAWLVTTSGVCLLYLFIHVSHLLHPLHLPVLHPFLLKLLIPLYPSSLPSTVPKEAGLPLLAESPLTPLPLVFLWVS